MNGPTVYRTNNEAGGLYDVPASKKSSTNELNAQIVAKLKADQAKNRSLADYSSGRNDGAREVYADFNRRLAESKQYTPIVEGSPEDILMQENTTKGINYKEETGPGFMESLRAKIDSVFSKNLEPTGAANFDDQYQEQRMRQEADLKNHMAQQPGLAELASRQQ